MHVGCMSLYTQFNTPSFYFYICLTAGIIKFYYYRREALETWKQTKGENATYRNLIDVFTEAGYRQYANTVRKICSKFKNIIHFQASYIH